MSEVPIILVVEDREDDVVLITSSLQRAKIPNPVYVVRNGEDAIEYLSGVGKYQNREEYPLPELLLLDLKLPRKDGFEVLRWIHEQRELCGLRVVVLTSSEDIRDVNRAYQLGANSFLIKPLDFHNFVEMGHWITDYWLKSDKAPAIYRPPSKQVNKGATAGFPRHHRERTLVSRSHMRRR